jgi:hypothetical protein
MKWDIFPEFLDQFCSRVDLIMQWLPEQVINDERVKESITHEAKKITRYADLWNLKKDIEIKDASNDDNFLYQDIKKA